MDARIREEAQSVKASRLNEWKPRGATKAQLAYRARFLAGAAKLPTYDTRTSAKADGWLARLARWVWNAARP
jgi:hypothetical protein